MPLNEIAAVKAIVSANAAAVYKDAAQPSIRVLGKSLAQSISLFATPVGRMAEIFEKNIHRYLDKLDGLKEEEIVPPSTRILVPILEKMRFTEEEKVAEYYAEILATASKKEHSGKALITFIEILNRLTSDEIKILEFINSLQNVAPIPELTEDELTKHKLPRGTKNILVTGSLAVIEVQLWSEGGTGYTIYEKNFNNLNESIALDSPENIGVYIDNMVSLGLLEKGFGTTFAIDKIYFHLENHPLILKLKEKLATGNRIEIKKEKIDLTDLGKKLLSLGSSEK